MYALNGSESILDAPKNSTKIWWLIYIKMNIIGMLKGFNNNNYNSFWIISRFLQNLYKGHPHNFREFHRDQTIVKHSKSFNISESLRQAYHVYYKYYNIHNVENSMKSLNIFYWNPTRRIPRKYWSYAEKKTLINYLCSTLNYFNTNLDLLAHGFRFDLRHPSWMELR